MTLAPEITKFSIFDAPVLRERPWAVFAACREEPALTFFPETKSDERHALAICEMCPVQEDCLEHAIETRERFGVWGGTTEKARRAIIADFYA